MSNSKVVVLVLIAVLIFGRVLFADPVDCTAGCKETDCVLLVVGVKLTCWKYDNPKSCDSFVTPLSAAKVKKGNCDDAGTGTVVKVYQCKTEDCTETCKGIPLPEEALCPALTSCTDTGGKFKQKTCQ
jgi:hypothetical protein